MNAAKNGYVAEFVTGYLQREIRMELKVANGTDTGVRDPLQKGIAVGRLVKINGGYLVPATSLNTDAEYIVAQSDDTIRDLPEDYNYTERYNYVPNLIVKNSEETKTVALYKIVNRDDVKLVKIAEPVDMITGAMVSNDFVAGPRTYQFLQTGINSYKVIGTIIYTVSNPDNNPDGNILTFKMKNSDITARAQLPTGDIYKRISESTTKRVNTATRSDFEDDGSVVCNICVNDGTNRTNNLIVEVEWLENQVSHYTFDLSEVTMVPVE